MTTHDSIHPETIHSERQTGEHILVCLSSAPSNPRIVQTGARMAQAFHGTLTNALGLR